jgi:hypothetical protein
MKRKRFTEEQIAFALRKPNRERLWLRLSGSWAYPSRPFIAGKGSMQDLGLPSLLFRISPQGLRILLRSLPLKCDQRVIGRHAKPQCFRDSRDAKNDSFWGALRETQRRRRHALSCMGATEVLENSQEVRFFQGKA